MITFEITVGGSLYVGPKPTNDLESTLKLAKQWMKVQKWKSDLAIWECDESRIKLVAYLVEDDGDVTIVRLRPRALVVPSNPEKRYEAWAEWDYSPFNHPECPTTATHLVAYSEDPSFAKEDRVEFFDSFQAAASRMVQLKLEGFYCRGPYNR